MQAVYEQHWWEVPGFVAYVTDFIKIFASTETLFVDTQIAWRLYNPRLESSLAEKCISRFLPDEVLGWVSLLAAVNPCRDPPMGRALVPARGPYDATVGGPIQYGPIYSVHLGWYIPVICYYQFHLEHLQCGFYSVLVACTSVCVPWTPTLNIMASTSYWPALTVAYISFWPVLISIHVCLWTLLSWSSSLAGSAFMAMNF